MFVLGMDIGYSNLKIVFGEAGVEAPTIITLPGGAAPRDYVSTSFSGRLPGGYEVTVEDEDYIAGIDQSSIEGWHRVLSHEYPFTDDYRALFYASLLATERSEIDLLVTGLPVEQANDQAYRQRLEKHLQGIHQVSREQSITVHEVKVIPQPVGAFFTYLMECENPQVVQQSRVLVIDPGFYSVDYCAIDRGNFDRASADSSQEAMSVLLEEAGKLVQDDTGRPFDLSTLESSVRGNRQIPVFGEMVDLTPYLDWAAGNVAERVMRQIRQNLRRSKIQGADFILLTGGGATLYKEAASSIMEGSKVVMANNPVGANANGYFEYGRA